MNRKQYQRGIRSATCHGSIICTSLMLFLILPTHGLQAQSAPHPTATDLDDESQSVIQKMETVSRLSKTAKSATEYTTIIDQCDQILQSQPENNEHVTYVASLKAWALNRRAKTRMELADRFEKIGNADQAMHVLQSARDDLDAAIAADSGKWQALQNRAVLLTRINEFESAAADWTQLISLRSDSPEAKSAIFNRAELLYQAGKYDEALGDYRWALEFDAADVQSINGCGNCLLAMGQAAEAIECYERILEIDPKNPGALVNRGDAWQQLGQWSAALADYRESQAAATSGRTLQRIAWLLATCPDESLCDPPAALSSIQEAIALDGETAENLDTLAAAWAANGQFDKARDVQTRVIAMSDSGDDQYQVRQTLYENDEPFRQPDDQ